MSVFSLRMKSNRQEGQKQSLNRQARQGRQENHNNENQQSRRMAFRFRIFDIFVSNELSFLLFLAALAVR
jgi:hypothetical protein